MALDQVVTDMKVIYGAGAALLVGIGLGLQQTFNDFSLVWSYFLSVL